MLKLEDAELLEYYTVLLEEKDKNNTEFDSDTIIECIGSGLFRRVDTGCAVNFTKDTLLLEVD